MVADLKMCLSANIIYLFSVLFVVFLCLLSLIFCYSFIQSVDQDNSGSITALELRQALVNNNWSHFNEETCRLLVGMFDKDRWFYYFCAVTNLDYYACVEMAPLTYMNLCRYGNTYRIGKDVLIGMCKVYLLGKYFTWYQGYYHFWFLCHIFHFCIKDIVILMFVSHFLKVFDLCVTYFICINNLSVGISASV